MERETARRSLFFASVIARSIFLSSKKKKAVPPPLSFLTGAHTGEKLNRADFCGSLNTAFGGAISGREPCSPRKRPSLWLGAEAQKTCTRRLAALGMTKD